MIPDRALCGGFLDQTLSYKQFPVRNTHGSGYLLFTYLNANKDAADCKQYRSSEIYLLKKRDTVIKSGVHETAGRRRVGRGGDEGDESSPILPHTRAYVRAHTHTHTSSRFQPLCPRPSGPRVELRGRKWLAENSPAPQTQRSVRLCPLLLSFQTPTRGHSLQSACPLPFCLVAASSLIWK